MKKWVVLLVLILACTTVNAQCNKPFDGKKYSYDRELCDDTFFLPHGISIARDNVVIDCNHAVLRGTFQNTGITIKNQKNILIKNCNLANYAIGIYLFNTTNITVYESTFMRNNIGLRIEKSSNNFFDENKDISLEKPIKLILSYNNTIRYINKEIKEDYCRYNYCNIKSNTTSPEEKEKESLLNVLKSTINSWLKGMD